MEPVWMWSFNNQLAPTDCAGRGKKKASRYEGKFLNAPRFLQRNNHPNSAVVRASKVTGLWEIGG